MLDRPHGSNNAHSSGQGPARPGAVVSRVALLLLAAAALYQGVWAQVAPRSFFDNFPGGMGWVRVEGPYNEHLVRDVGGLVNGLAVVAIVAAWTLSRSLLVANALGWLTYALPHLYFHVSHPLDRTPMQALNVVVLVSEIVLPLLGMLGVPARGELRSGSRSHHRRSSSADAH